MSSRRLIAWAGVIVATVVGAHLVSSVAIAYALERSYTQRVPDLRRWTGRDASPSAPRELLARFIHVHTRHANRPAIVFLGSSFTFGYPWQERVVLSRRYSELRADRAVINASVTGGALSVVHDWGVCGAARQADPIDTVVIEIPVVNTAAHLLNRIDAGLDFEPLATCDRDNFLIAGYWPFVAKHPLGLGWIRFLWDVEAYEKSEEPITIVKVPTGYFATRANFAKVKPEYDAEIAQALTNAKTVARNVYVFPSPVYLPALDEIGEDRLAVRDQLQATLDACHVVAGVVCLDPSEFYDRRDLYYNMTHLNQRGHQVIAEWFAASIAPPR